MFTRQIVALNEQHYSMPDMRNPAHLQAYPTQDTRPRGGNQYRRDHSDESLRFFVAALSRFCFALRTVRPFDDPFVGRLASSFIYAYCAFLPYASAISS